MLRITAQTKECSRLAINWQSRSQCQCIWTLMSDFLLVTLIQADEFQHLRLSTSNKIALKCSYQELIRILLASWYPGLVPRLLCTRAGGKRLSGIVYTHASCIAENGTLLLWPDTCNDLYLTFQALVKMCLSHRMILLTLKCKTL